MAVEQFPDLVAHVFVVLGHALGAVVRVMPVALGVIDAEFHSGPFAGRGHLADDVALERRGHHVVVGELRVPHAEAVVVLGDLHDVFHAGRLGLGDDLVGIEHARVK